MRDNMRLELFSKNKTPRNALIILFVVLLTLTPACATNTPSLTHSQTSSPPPTSTTPPTTQYPAVGTVLPIELLKGSGTGWSNGIEFSKVRFTFGYLDADIVGLPSIYKAGSPVIYFSGVVTNNSGYYWYTRWSTVETTTLDYYGIWGSTGTLLESGTSFAFKVPLQYVPGLTTITVNVQVAVVPFP